MRPLMFIEWEEKGCGVVGTILLGTVGNGEYFPHVLIQHVQGQGPGG